MTTANVETINTTSQAPDPTLNQTPLLQVQDVRTSFAIKRKGSYFWQKPDTLKAVDGVSFELFAGETLGVVGESGCGKSTLARTIIGLVRANSGSIKFNDAEIVGASKKTMRIKRKDIQMIFQDPLASLNPRMTVGDIIAEPLRTYYPKMKKAEVQDEVRAIMKKVGLLSNQINRYPHEFSGGQCQRIGIARALILKPKIIICDEPVSALDVSIQAQVINLLQDIQEEMGLALIFIAHDLSVVKHIADRVLVMYLGHAVELGVDKAVYGNPTHPYTQALMSAVPLPDPIAERNKTIQLLEGDLPSPIHPPSGCVFRTRCPLADAECAQIEPVLEGTINHRVACLKNKVETTQ
ncbi:murein tripeptide/oligopeptide ABC transporter ATP binding protein OppF [Psychrobacter sp. 1U1]|uniref:murein tripeptide/oligopeptide ABC transporter ATP binding protein OppF n=1 Tax=Psychrobacter sp. 1U1 TaxID=3453576 RepID=UPI002639D239|nr:murein tripeptide/oligopeptide ABC transporter ATP binding protein OppF [uncultured Psychrobacter sp.]